MSPRPAIRLRTTSQHSFPRRRRRTTRSSRTDSTERRDVLGRLQGAPRPAALSLGAGTSTAITDPGVMTMKLHALALLIAAAVLPAAHAGVIDKANQQATQTWSAWGGTLGVRWNRDL